MNESARAGERFHLSFLLLLHRHMPDGWAVKGGANLRFFHGSPRASKDLDIDTFVDSSVIEKKVTSLLASPALSQELRSSNLSLLMSHPSKMTPTTMRWKPELVAPDGRTFSTKVEFSSRVQEEAQAGIDWLKEHQRADLVSRNICELHDTAMQPLAVHYDAVAAYSQKIGALALRTATKTRDVFDMNWLLSRHPKECAQAPMDLTAEAAQRAMELEYDQFRTEVVPFLDNDIYATRNAWNQMQDKVVSALIYHQVSDESIV